VITHNSDLLTDLEPEALLATHDSGRYPATLAVSLVDSGADLKLDGARVERFVDRRLDPHEAGATFIGMGVFTREALEFLPSTVPAGLGETLLKTLAERGMLGIHLHDGYALDVGTFPRYLQASLDVLYERAPARPSLRGWSHGEVVEVDGGRAWHGDRSLVVRSSLGPGAILLDGAIVEDGARVKDSVVFGGGVVPAGTELDRSVWFGGRAIPAGAEV
jgi:mannose-1-phosphate guanylyltransferase